MDSVQIAESYFKVRVDEITTSIQRRMNAYEQVLLGGVGLFYANENVERASWKTYIDKLNIEKHYQGILGIGYSLVLRPEEVNNHIAEVRAEGFPEYKIWPEYEREIYTTIVFLEPFSGRNLRAFGYDMFTERIRRDAMTKARDSAITSVSGKVTLVQETSTNVQPGFLVYIPVYNKNMPVNTVEQRREAIRGYVYSPFRIGDLMKGILDRGLSNISLQIYDESDTSETGLMFSSHPGIKTDQPRFSITTKSDLYNHHWTLKFETLPSFEQNRIDQQKPAIVLLTGIVISILFFIVVVSYVRTNEARMDLELLLSSSGEGIYGMDSEGKCIFINDAAMEMLDLTIEQCKGHLMHDLIHHHYADNRVYPFNECPIYDSLSEGTSYNSDTEVFFRSDGSMFQVNYSFNPIIQDNSVTGGVVTFSDISERMKIQKALKVSEEKFRLAVDNFPYTFIIYDKERRISFINSIGRKSFYLPGWIIGKRDEEILPEQITGCYLPFLIAAFEEKTNQTTECTINLYGNDFSFIANFVPLLNDTGEIDQVLGITHDITELNKAQTKIINSLKEKDVLLKEIHHRVKNNLQIISSLLNLQINKIKDEPLIDILRESQNRVRSMALVHERLYQTANMSQIDFSEYIPELLNYLVSSYNNQENPVSLELKIDKTKFGIDISISLALIINELVSNSMKHAFKGKNRNDNKINISLNEKEKYELIISDNGNGFPGDVDFKNSNSLGLQLVNSLVEQIDGEIFLERETGTKFTILFPV